MDSLFLILGFILTFLSKNNNFIELINNIELLCLHKKVTNMNIFCYKYGNNLIKFYG